MTVKPNISESFRGMHSSARKQNMGKESCDGVREKIQACRKRIKEEVKHVRRNMVFHRSLCSCDHTQGVMTSSWSRIQDKHKTTDLRCTKIFLYGITDCPEWQKASHNVTGFDWRMSLHRLPRKKQRAQAPSTTALH